MEKNKTVITVENIKCGGCISTIQDALSKMTGIQKVNVDLESGTIAVFGTADRHKVVMTLAKLGYPEMGNNTFLLKAKSYVSCALGKMGSDTKK